MSATGKSTTLAELARRGLEVVDTDESGWTVWSEAEDGYVWREDRVAELLAWPRDGPLFVSGCVSNQGCFYDRFDAVVLLSAPADVLLARLERRTTNPYGKSPEDRALILEHLAEVEPLLRATCTHELDATRPVEEVVARLVEFGAGSRYARRSSSITSGSTSCRSPTTAQSARATIGASLSLFTTRIPFAALQPTMCWIAPLIPHAM